MPNLTDSYSLSIALKKQREIIEQIKLEKLVLSERLSPRDAKIVERRAGLAVLNDYYETCKRHAIALAVEAYLKSRLSNG